MEAIGEDGLRLTGSPKWQDLVSSFRPIRDAEMIFRDYLGSCLPGGLFQPGTKTIGVDRVPPLTESFMRKLSLRTSLKTVPDDFVSRHLDDPLRLLCTRSNRKLDE